MMWHIKILALVLAVQVAVVVSVVVQCDHKTEICDCSSTIYEDTCEFTLEIEHLQTFTRYQVTPDGMSRGTAARVWYINETGDFNYHSEPVGSTVCKVPIDDKSCTEPFAVDGYTFRSFIAINGRIPGPTLIVHKDQYIVVHVINRLASESVSIHWHGMHQRNSNWMDGVEHVTQCGILPGAQFTYVFHAEQSGTHWYHSHSGAQRTDGFFGALIIRENETRLAEVVKKVNAFQDKPEHTLTFLDWQDENSIDLFTLIHSSVRFFGEPSAPGENVEEPPRTFSTDLSEVGPVPHWSALINGRGRHRDVSYNKSRLSVFTVEQNTTYRFRLIGAQSLYAYRVSIDEHKLKVIASDGAFVNPITADYIILHSGERFDFLLETKSQPSQQNFMIRAETLEAFGGSLEPEPQPFEPDVVEAILHYNTEDNNPLPRSSDYEGINKSSIPVELTCNETSPCLAVNCPFKSYPSSFNINCVHIHQLTTMFPLTKEDGLPDTSDVQRLFLNFGFEGTRYTSAINARNMKLPSTPLTQLVSDPEQLQTLRDTEYCKGLDNATVCDDKLVNNDVIAPDCLCTHVHELQDDGKSVQLVISAVAPDPVSGIDNARSTHPVHLHGHYFHVVDIQYGEYNEDGHLTKLNEDINCGGEYLCTKPSWATGAVNRNYSEMIANAPLKDTLIIPFGGYAVVYYTPNNPGYWFLHCHIEVHQLEGMSVIIGEQVNKAKAIPEGMPQCGNFEFDVDAFKKARAGGARIYSDLRIIGILLLTSFVIVKHI